MQEDRDYWFPAKHFGWGWGLPIRWQGWLVLGAFLLLLPAGQLFLEAGAYFVCFTVLALALVVICWWKGEPPRWHWGGDDRA